MKIAYEKKLPDAREYALLTEGACTADDRYTRAVLAYDGNLLIGVGGYRKAGVDMEAAEEWSFIIHPKYARRDIEPNMKRLLS